MNTLWLYPKRNSRNITQSFIDDAYNPRNLYDL